MAVLWSGHSNGETLEVRSAGSTRRLYCDGVLHTQYNPNHILTGDVWDPMGLAPAAAPAGCIQRALILGLGGGAAVQILRRVFGVASITAVELDPRRSRLGRKFFGLKMKDVHLVAADAIQWVHNYEGPPFDLVIDDLFGQIDGEPVRAQALSSRWLRKLESLTSQRGVLVANCLDWSELKESPLLASKTYTRKFKGAIHCTHHVSWNHIVIMSRSGIDPLAFESRIRVLPALQKPSIQRRLRFQTRSLW